MQVDDSLNDSFLSQLSLAGVVRFEFPHLKKYLETFRHLKNSGATGWELGLLEDSSLHVKDLKIMYGSNDQALLEVDRAAISWEKLKGRDLYPFARSLKMDVQGYRVHREGFGEVLSYLGRYPNNMPWMLGIEDVGKSDFSLQARLLLPQAPDKAFSTILPCQFRVEVENSHMTSALGKASIQGNIEFNKPSSQTSALTFACTLKNQVSSQYRDFLLAWYQNLIQQLQDEGYFASSPRLENLLVNHWNQVAELIPDFAPVGPIETQLDFSIHTRQNDELHEDTAIQLNKCRVKTPQYEIALQSKKGFKETLEDFFFDIQITNHQALIQNVAHYYSRWRSLLTSTHTVEETEIPLINPQIVHQITRFLESLSQPIEGQAKKLHICIQGKDSNELTIGPFNKEQFNQHLDQFSKDLVAEIYPHLKDLEDTR